jgi:hypothetical protein
MLRCPLVVAPILPLRLLNDRYTVNRSGVQVRFYAETDHTSRRFRRIIYISPIHDKVFTYYYNVLKTFTTSFAS